MASISIIIPALNERESIVRTIQSIPKIELENLGFDVRILVVDNGSDDGTGDLARKAGADVVFEPNRGYGYAYKTGFAHSNGDIIITEDADLSYPSEDIPKLIKILINNNLDFITTNRYGYIEKDSMSNLHKLGNSILNLITRLLFGIPLRDSQSGMWVFRRTILEKAILRSNTMALSEEIKIEACYFLNCRWLEVPIRYRKRIGKIKLRSWRDGLGNLIFLIKKRINR